MDTTPKRRNMDARVAANLEEHLPALKESLGTQRAARRRSEIENAIDPNHSGRLQHWVAVAVWECEDGSMETEVVHDGRSSELEMKGYLHDAVWQSAHLT